MNATVQLSQGYGRVAAMCGDAGGASAQVAAEVRDALRPGEKAFRSLADKAE